MIDGFVRDGRFRIANSTLSMKKKQSNAEVVVVPIEFIEHRIYFIRGQKVMLDADLARLYQVPAKRLNEAVKRNLTRFPEDFMFRLVQEEANT